MDDIKLLLNNFLEIINYPDNREDFINKFISNSYLESVEVELTKLPADKQVEVNNQLKIAVTFHELQKIVNENFDQKEFEETLKLTTQKLFTEYLQLIDADLSEEQKNKLVGVFSS